MITRIHRANYSCFKKAKKKSNQERTFEYSIFLGYEQVLLKLHRRRCPPSLRVIYFSNEPLIQHALNFHPAIRGFNEIYSQGVENEADWPLAYSRFNEWRWKTRMGKVKNSNFSVKRIYAAPPMGAPVQRGCSTMKIDDSSKLTCSNGLV